jgi:hypothetical protein
MRCCSSLLHGRTARVTSKKGSILVFAETHQNFLSLFANLALYCIEILGSFAMQVTHEGKTSSCHTNARKKSLCSHTSKSSSGVFARNVLRQSTSSTIGISSTLATRSCSVAAPDACTKQATFSFKPTIFSACSDKSWMIFGAAEEVMSTSRFGESSTSAPASLSTSLPFPFSNVRFSSSSRSFVHRPSCSRSHRQFGHQNCVLSRSGEPAALVSLGLQPLHVQAFSVPSRHWPQTTVLHPKHSLVTAVHRRRWSPTALYCGHKNE